MDNFRIITQKILIVDDEEPIRRIVGLFLLKEGFNVFTACNGEEALKKMSEVSPDLVVLDFIMPGINGLEVRQKIRKNPLYKSLPILMLTGYEEELSELKGFNSNIDGYMKKPFDSRELISKVKIYLKYQEMKLTEKT